jgi:hypothetical protein
VTSDGTKTNDDVGTVMISVYGKVAINDVGTEFGTLV